MNKFYKGRTTNHLTFMMVDATDFATPESALSAATKIKIYGKLQANDTVYLVSSGTGSLTNDIKHVGASALGIYTIGLVKADLSDASAAWYDQYIISLSATGAAYQTLVVDGGINDSYFSNVVSYLSNVVSYLSNMESNLSGIGSDILSAARGNSDALSKITAPLIAEGVWSDFVSKVGYTSVSNLFSYLSDMHSKVNARTTGMSDILSKVYVLDTGISDSLSNTHADLALLTPSAIANKVWSDFGSLTGGTASDLVSTVTKIKSMLATMSGVGSDTYSLLVSRVPKATATASALTKAYSQLTGLSDVASKVYAQTTGISDVLSNTHADLGTVGSGVDQLQSRVNKMAATASALTKTQSQAVGLSDILSKVYVLETGLSDVVSNIHADLSNLSNVVSNIHTDLADLSGVASNVYSLVLGTNKGREHFNKGTGIYTKYADGATKLWSHAVASDAVSVVRGVGA